MNFNVAVVIVTYNRLTKLSKALYHYENQIEKPKYVIVVNNNSNDGTKEYLKVWENKSSNFQKVVINLSENVGGSGGFYEGEKYAAKLDDVDWIMISDDDAYPEEKYIAGMKEYVSKLSSTDYVAVVCGKVIQNNSYVNIHRTYLVGKWNWNFHNDIPEHKYATDYFKPDFVSYVGILINKRILNKAGFVEKDFFIWNDDTEHSYRLKKYGDLICIPKYSILHDVDPENNELTWKYFYSYRNKTIVFKKHFKLQMPFVVAITIVKTLLCPLKGKSFAEVKLRLTAIKDGLLGNLGKHPVYKPGWKP